jgi:hypothetical protein
MKQPRRRGTQGDHTTTEPLFEPTDYDRRKNVERALISTVNDPHVKIQRTADKLEALTVEVTRAQAALRDFCMPEPLKADMDGVIAEAVDVVNSGAFDMDGVTVRAEVV